MAFFSCPKCQRIWQYPIEKCPYCFLVLERKKTKKARIIEMAKVSLPSIWHSRVPYFILVLEDEEGKKWIQKSKKEYKIGENFEIEKKEGKNGVAIWRVKYDFLEVIEKVVEIFGGLKISGESKVLILPTLIKPSHPYFRDNTSPEFLESILTFLFQLGAKPENIKVAAQSFDEIEIGAKALKSGLLEICQKYKVLPFDLAKGNFVKKGDLEISEEVFKADIILNLPIMKMGKASATENLFFLLKKESFLAQKYLFSEREVFEKLTQKLPAILTIAEANHVQDEKGISHYLNLVLASFQPLNLDFIFAKITNSSIPEILNNLQIESIPVLGRQIEEVEFNGRGG